MTNAHEQKVVWTRHDLSGHEACRVLGVETGWRLEGVAVFAHDRQPCRLDYRIECDPHWVTRTADVTGWLGNPAIEVLCARDGDGRWQLNGHVCEDVTGCVDVDLNFSPSTNLLPIRRLSPAVASFALEPLEQTYTRLGDGRYRYETFGDFVAEVTVDEMGLAIRYGKLWAREA